MNATGPLYAGIDGGQSSTTAVVGDAAGAVLGRGLAGPADEVGEPLGSRRMATSLEAALAAALSDAGLPARTPLAVVVAGISGYEGEVRGAVPDLGAARTELMHDAPIAFAGALDAPGVLLVSGTGSVAYAEDGNGKSSMVGGWGYLFGDEGSAFWIARRALSAAMAAVDDGRASRIREAALAMFGVKDLRTFARAYYVGDIDRKSVAAFAPSVCSLAADDPEAAVLVTDAGFALAVLATKAAAAVGLSRSFRVAFSGGAFADRELRAATTAELMRITREVEVVRPRAAPEIGALTIARRLGEQDQRPA